MTLVKMELSLSSLCLVIALVFVSGEEPRALTENGPVVGEFATSYSGQRYMAFKGIPYAAPPVGGNRFKEPQRLEKPWIGEWQAKTLGPSCMQLDQFTFKTNGDGKREYQAIGDEDCLYLNVFTREGGPANKSVVFAIHGGAFMFATGGMYGPKYIMDRPDIVFVTFSYRLGPLGFITTGDSVIPGNMGLKDQLAALEWTNRNIANFGGDPSKITIVGLSAGGASVDYMYLSPRTNGLFQKGYSFSGTALCPWALVTNGVLRTRQLAENLGCFTTDSKAILKCLRRRPALQIVNQVKSFLTWEYNPFTTFGPVVEPPSPNAYIDQHPRDILRKGLGKDLPWVAGVTTEEGIYPAADYILNENLMNEFNDQWNDIASSVLFFDPYLTKKQQERLATLMKNEYIGEGPIDKSKQKELIKMLTDQLFTAAIAETANLRANTNKQPVYLYEYGYQGATSLSQTMSYSDVLMGASHGDDTSSIIDLSFLQSHTTPEDIKMASILKDIFFSYVVTNTIPEKYGWKPVKKSKERTQLNFLKMKNPNDVKMSKEPLGRLDFLSRIFKETVTKDEL